MKHYLDFNMNVTVVEGKLEPQTKNRAENAKVSREDLEKVL